MIRRLLKFNTREKAVSNDYNRLQKFLSTQQALTAAARWLDKRPGTYDYPGLTVPVSTTETPLAAVVLGGSLVRVDNATSLLVDPGCIVGYQTLASPDADDTAIFIANDPGVTALGTPNMTFTANAGGSPRLDVIECQPAVVVTENSSRDVFNTGINQYQPTPVDKVIEVRMTYRIRLGTPGSGFPGVAAGWLPLAVACVQPGAASFAAVDFWDVRPLVDDKDPLINQPNPATQFSPVRNCEFATGDDSGTRFIGGYIETSFGGYRAGGRLMNSAANQAAYFGLTTTIGGEFANFTILPLPPAVTLPVYIYAVFPHGLPRWVRYKETADVTYGRVPRGPRGILQSSTTAPSANGVASVALDPINGFTSNQPGALLTVLFSQGATHGHSIGAGKRHRFLVAKQQAPSSVVNTGGGDAVAQWTSLPMPANTSRIRGRVRFSANWGTYTPGNTFGNCVLSLVTSFGSKFNVASVDLPASNNVLTTHELAFDFPVPPKQNPLATSQPSFLLELRVPTLVNNSFVSEPPLAASFNPGSLEIDEIELGT